MAVEMRNLSIQFILEFLLGFSGEDDGDEDDVSDKSSVNETMPTPAGTPTSPVYPPEGRRDKDGEKKAPPKSFLHNKTNHLNNNNAAEVSSSDRYILNFQLECF